MGGLKFGVFLVGSLETKGVCWGEYTKFWDSKYII
ncbi:MAG: hypothetical protein CM15mV109_080 [uncultured marine virus]|nr:MAG: hypothetical protein CM15mV109_080 [uncultured marine virus]